jgi:hypothetical protein
LYVALQEGRFDGRYGLGGDRDRCRELLATLSQHAGTRHGAAALERVIETNGFVVEGGGATVVFLTISRFNHDCESNVRFEWDANEAVGKVVCKETVKPGTELTLNYGASGAFDERQRHLRERFGFVCGCALCVREAAVADALPGAAPIATATPPISTPPSPQ